MATLALLLLWQMGFAQSWELRVCAEPDALPFSNKAGAGFENQIAALLAKELKAKLRYVWLVEPYDRTKLAWLDEGRCDLIMGIPDNTEPLSTSLAYYRTSYVFVQRNDSAHKITSFDDPLFKTMRIGVQSKGGAISPTSYVLAKRGLIPNQVSFKMHLRGKNTAAQIVNAVLERRVDVAVVWGPIAGYFAAAHPGELALRPVSPQFELPFVAFVASMSIGVRQGEDALEWLLDEAIARRWADIQGILTSFHVPLEPLEPLPINTPSR